MVAQSGGLVMANEIEKRKEAFLIYQDNRTHKNFLIVRQKSNCSARRQMSHYNQDMIIAVDHRVKSI